MKKAIGYLGIAFLIGFVACSPDDRSSEQPFKPTVVNKGFEVTADSCLLRGEITSSPNSTVKGCGFKYGNDTLRAEIRCAEPTENFSAYTRRLGPGTYYAVAFAENGVGKAMAPDSVYFTILE